MRLRPLVLAVLAVLTVPGSAAASGITTHAFMAEAAIPFVADPQLRMLLDAHRDEVRSGAHYPDGGYGSSSYPGGDYGEISHWESFTNAYAAHLRARGDCGDLTAPGGPCADEIAHLMGNAGHGVGDEMWDWLFEPRMKDYGETPVHPAYRSGLPGSAELAGLPPGSYANTPEFAMDNIALAEHGRAPLVPLYPPPFDDLLAVYRDLGRGDITRDGIVAGHTLITTAATAERAALPAEYPRVKLTMPRSSAEYLTGAGGVLDVAEAAAGYYEALWRKLTGDAHPAPRVVSTYPEAGQTGTETRFTGVSSSPGPDGGGARSRIIAVLSNSLDVSSVTPDAFRLLDAAGEPVAPAAGWPRPGPYGAGFGTHSMMFWPAADLRPCHTYTAVVTGALRDHAGAAPAEHRWSFTTGAQDGNPCAEAPAVTGPQALTVHAGHSHGAPVGSLVALRGARRSTAGIDVLLTCVGPAACTGHLTLTTRSAGRSADMVPVRYALPRGASQTIAVAPSPAAAALLGGGRAGTVDVRAGGGTSAATSRTFALR